MNVSSYIDHHRDENLTGMMIAAFLEIIAIIFACAIQKVNASANKAFDSYITKESRKKNECKYKMAVSEMRKFKSCQHKILLKL